MSAGMLAVWRNKSCFYSDYLMPAYCHHSFTTPLKLMNDREKFIKLQLFIFQDLFGLHFLSELLDGVSGFVRSFSYGCLGLFAGFLSDYKESEGNRGQIFRTVIHCLMKAVKLY